MPLQLREMADKLENSKAVEAHARKAVYPSVLEENRFYFQLYNLALIYIYEAYF